MTIIDRVQRRREKPRQPTSREDDDYGRIPEYVPKIRRAAGEMCDKRIATSSERERCRLRQLTTHLLENCTVYFVRDGYDRYEWMRINSKAVTFSREVARAACRQ